MKRHVLAISVKLRSPFLFPDTVAGRFGLDRIALRNAQGHPIVPQDQLRGVLLHACGEAAAAMGIPHDLRQDLFGRGSAEARETNATQAPNPQDFDPARGRILFADLVGPDPGPVSRSVRVEIDPDTGAADDGKLMFAELVAPPGTEVTFSGEAVLLATDTEANQWIPLLQAAATWVSAIGAMKSAGFGEVVGFTISRKGAVALAAKPLAPVSGRQGYALRFDRRFAVDVRRVADNIYVGQEIVPGSVIKGALARKLELCGRLQALDAAVSALAISHARPQGAPPAVPLCMVARPGTTTDPPVPGDALLVPFDKGALIRGQPALWMGDSKADARDAVVNALGFGKGPELRRSVRTHVAINPTTGSAEDRNLYAVSAIEPGDVVWHCVVDYDTVADPAMRAELAAALEAGLDGIGRTGACLRLERAAAPPLLPVVPLVGTTDRFAVVLETDAVMASPDDGADARAAYAKYWKRVLPGAELVNFYASQRLAGGYVARRYKAGQDYRPFWLTEAGSVFLLAGDIAQDLARLTRSGLPAPVINGQVTTWRTCPYQPENGYGAIRCNHDGALAAVVQEV